MQQGRGAGGAALRHQAANCARADPRRAGQRHPTRRRAADAGYGRILGSAMASPLSGPLTSSASNPPPTSGRQARRPYRSNLAAGAADPRAASGAADTASLSP